MASGWTSEAGNALWGLGFVVLAIAVALDSRIPSNRIGVTARLALMALGVYAALVMGYWILVDAAVIGRISPIYLAPAFLLALTGIAGYLVAVRAQRREHQLARDRRRGQG